MLRNQTRQIYKKGTSSRGFSHNPSKLRALRHFSAQLTKPQQPAKKESIQKNLLIENWISVNLLTWPKASSMCPTFTINKATGRSSHSMTSSRKRLSRDQVRARGPYFAAVRLPHAPKLTDSVVFQLNPMMMISKKKFLLSPPTQISIQCGLACQNQL